MLRHQLDKKKCMSFFFFSKYLQQKIILVPLFYKMKVVFINFIQHDASKNLLILYLLLQVCFKINVIAQPYAYLRDRKASIVQLILKKEALISFLTWFIIYSLPAIEDIQFRLKRKILYRNVFTVSGTFLRFPIIYELEVFFETLFISVCF